LSPIRTKRRETTRETLDPTRTSGPNIGSITPVAFTTEPISLRVTRTTSAVWDGSPALLSQHFRDDHERNGNSDQSRSCLVAPHMILRFLGISFFVPGVVSGSLPRVWAAPAGYGDFVAGVLAIIATIALAETAAWAILAVWIFNLWGAADLLFAFYKGARVRLEPGSLGAAFYIVTAIVPRLLVSHALIFALLLRASV
jgi:hypothetical protein